MVERDRSDLMSILINIGTILTGVLLIGIIIYLMVHKKINESQSVLWLLIGFITIVLGIFPELVIVIAEKLGVWYPPIISILVAFIVLLFITLKNTVKTSIHSDQLNELFLELTLAKDQIEKLKKEIEELKEGGDSD